jgi:Fe-S-cluster containining protein
LELETNIQRIKELAVQRDDENWRFRAFLKGIGLSIKKLDAIVHKHYEIISERIDCRACGNCCREVIPILSKGDVRRLAQSVNIPIGEFANKYLEPSREENAFTFKTRPCPFLSEKICTVYEARPRDCRSYPHLHKREFRFRLIQVVNNYSVCPIVFNLYEELKEVFWKSRRNRWVDE